MSPLAFILFNLISCRRANFRISVTLTSRVVLNLYDLYRQPGEDTVARVYSPHCRAGRGAKMLPLDNSDHSTQLSTRLTRTSMWMGNTIDEVRLDGQHFTSGGILTDDATVGDCAHSSGSSTVSSHSYKNHVSIPLSNYFQEQGYTGFDGVSMPYSYLESGPPPNCI